MSPFDHLEQFLQKHRINRFAIAVSGGGDSMAMAHLVSHYAQKHKSTVRALIVDHKLRAESTHEAHMTQKRCDALGIKSTILTWQHDCFIDSNIQKRAREARYSLLLKWCADKKFPYLLTAHHAYDLLETYLMRLFKGSSLRGLIAMHAILKTKEEIYIARPFLTMKQEILRKGLAKEHFIEDPSNKDIQHERVRVRNALKHLNFDIENFLKTYSKLEKVDNYLSKQAHCFLMEYTQGATLNLQALLSVDAVIFHYIIKNILIQYAKSATPYYVSDQALENLKNALKNNKSCTFMGLKFQVIDRQTLKIIKENGRNGGI